MRSPEVHVFLTVDGVHHTVAGQLIPLDTRTSVPSQEGRQTGWYSAIRFISASHPDRALWRMPFSGVLPGSSLFLLPESCSLPAASAAQVPWVAAGLTMAPVDQEQPLFSTALAQFLGRKGAFGQPSLSGGSNNPETPGPLTWPR